MTFKTPILLTVFNRPDNTLKVFEVLRKIKPLKLYISSDGPRSDKKLDKKLIKDVRDIFKKVDWQCQIKTLFNEKNLGCRKANIIALKWFFSNEEMGIILEDDSIANLDFFNFCENLLKKYADDKSISAISGCNFQKNVLRGNGSYFFSKFSHAWGWASWSRVFNNFDWDMSFWPTWKNSDHFFNLMNDKVERNYWVKIFDKVYEGKIDSWAYSWDAHRWYNDYLSIIPNSNLVSNIGFGEDSTHTTSKFSKFSKMPTKGINEIVHPNKIIRDIKADHWTFNYHYGGKFLRFPYNLIIFPYRLISYVYRMIKNFLI